MTSRRGPTSVKCTRCRRRISFSTTRRHHDMNQRKILAVTPRHLVNLLSTKNSPIRMVEVSHCHPPRTRNVHRSSNGFITLDDTSTEIYGQVVGKIPVESRLLFYRRHHH